MRWLIGLVALMVAPVMAQERLVTVGQTFAVGASHDGMNHDGVRLYIDGALWSEVRQASLCAGLWTIGVDDYGIGAGQTVRDGVHVGGGYGTLYRCVSGAVWVYGADRQWWQWVATAWEPRGVTAPALVQLVVPGLIGAVGVHGLQVSVYRGLEEEFKSTITTVTAVAESTTLQIPINVHVR